jgi:hypothetical protein
MCLSVRIVAIKLIIHGIFAAIYLQDHSCDIIANELLLLCHHATHPGGPKQYGLALYAMDILIVSQQSVF